MTQAIIPVTIRIMEKEYKISCPEGEHEALLASARYVNDNMQKIRDSGKVFGAEKVAIMSALNIANELLMNQHTGTDDKEIMARIDSIQSLVDTSLNTN